MPSRLCLALLLLLIAAVPVRAATTTTTRTIDDRSLKHTGSWTKVRASRARGRTLLRATRKGATLTARTPATGGGAVVFQVGRGRGTATISVGGRVRATVRTAARRTASRSYSFTGAGAVKITITKVGKGVYVDAVVLKGAAGTVPGRGSAGGTSRTAGGTTPAPAGPAAPAPPAASPVALGPLSIVDTGASGTSGNGQDVTSAAVAPNGRFIAFWSPATNLVPGVTDGSRHLYLKDLSNGGIRVLDTAQDGTLSNDHDTSEPTGAIAWKPDSGEVLFTSRATNLGPDVSALHGPFLYSKALDDNSVGIIAEKASIDAAWSPDGRKIAFGSEGDYCNSAAAQQPCGRTNTDATKLFWWSLDTGRYSPISATAAGAQPQPNGSSQDARRPVWSPDSRRVAFEYDGTQLGGNDTNIYTDIYVKDITTGAVDRISAPAGGQSDGTAEWPAWSPDGTKIAFDSKADNLVAGDNNSGEDVFVKDLGTGSFTAVTAPGGAFKLFSHRVPKWSPDGTRISFNSKSVDLIPGYVDGNQDEDIYIANLAAGTFQLASARADGITGNGFSTQWNIYGSTGGWLPDSRSLVFLSRATNFAGTDSNATNESLFLKSGL